MPSLTDLVHVIPPDKTDEPEDIFASAPGLIFTDDLRNLHGDPDSVVVYRSERFGGIELRTADPEGEKERRLFSHYVWNASILLAELISGGDGVWQVEGERVMELGAGEWYFNCYVARAFVLTYDVCRCWSRWYRCHACGSARGSRDRLSSSRRPGESQT